MAGVAAPVSTPAVDCANGEGSDAQGSRSLEAVRRALATSLQQELRLEPGAGFAKGLLLGAVVSLTLLALLLGYVVCAESVDVTVMSSLAGLIMAAFAWLCWRVQRTLIGPMKELRAWALQMCAGDLGARIAATPDAEFSKLSFHVNRLSQALDRLANDMDDVVSHQTEQLQARNQSLETLYDVAATVNRPPLSATSPVASNEFQDSDQILLGAARRLLPVANSRAAVLRVPHKSLTRLVDVVGFAALVKAYDEEQAQLPEIAISDDIKVIDKTALEQLGWPADLCREDECLICIPLSYRQQVMGSLDLIAANGDEVLAPELRRLLQSVGAHLGMALEKHRLDSESHHLSLMRERNALAHELHDSLAQTIASLGLQASMLQETIATQNYAGAQRECARVRGAIDEAHTELRELLANFRAPVNEAGLMAALDNIAARAQATSGCAVYVQLEGREPKLAVGVHLQVTRIVSEALINAGKHAHAQMLRVLVQYDATTDLVVLIEDDGDGIGAQILAAHPGERLGLSIMRERAQRAGGSLTIESEPEEGTRVELRIPHSALATASGYAQIVREEGV